LLLDLGTLINYLIILGDASFKVAQIWGYDQMIDRRVIIISISMLVIFPPCLFRSISLYEKFSIVKIIGILVVVCVVIYQWILYQEQANDENIKHEHVESDIVWFNISGIPSATGIIAYCFVCHDTAFLFYNTLKNPTTLRWSQTVMLSIGSAMLLSVVLSIPAYLTFGSEVQGNILNNYPDNELSIIITRIIYVIMMALTYPTAFFVVRHVVYANYVRLVSLIKIKRFERKRKKVMLLGDVNNDLDLPRDDVVAYSKQVMDNECNVANAPLIQHVVVSSIIFFIPLTVAMFVTNLGTTMSIIGSLSSMNLAFMLPCFCSIKSSEYGFWSWISAETAREKWNAWSEIWPPFVLGMFGAFIAIYGVILTLTS